MFKLVKPIPSKAGRYDIKEATKVVQEIVQNPQELRPERVEKNKRIIEEAIAGNYDAIIQSKELIAELLDEFEIEIEDMSIEEAIEEMYSYMWGLGPIDKIYRDEEVNEIQINDAKQVNIIRNLITERTDIAFKDDEEIRKIISRMIMHDRGVSLNSSNPTIESMWKDGTRITATCHPVSDNTTAVLRKQLTKVLTLEDLLKSETLDEKTWALLRNLVSGRASILISGAVGSGKSSILRTLFGLSNINARTAVLENDRELFLKKHFPDRNIIELEEHPEANRTLNTLFRTILRYSPNIIIVGEFRGAGEAKEAIRACERGMHGSIVTCHFGSPREAIEGTSRLLLEEGMNISPLAATLMVAGAYNIVLQMFGDSTRGIIKVDKITEIIYGQDKVEYNDLIKWEPEGDDYKIGEWKVVGKPSQRLINRMQLYGVSNPMAGVL